MKKIIFIAILLMLTLPSYCNENIETSIGRLSYLIYETDKTEIPNVNLAKAYYLRGVIYEDELKDNSKALSDYNNAIKYNPNHKQALWRASKIKQEFKDFSGAIQDINKLIVLSPDDEGLHYLAALFYSELKDYNKAVDECTKSIKIKNKNPDAFYWRGILELKLGNKKGYQDLEYAKQQYYEINDIEQYKKVSGIIHVLKESDNLANIKTNNQHKYTTKDTTAEEIKKLNNTLQQINRDSWIQQSQTTPQIIEINNSNTQKGIDIFDLNMMLY